MKPIGSSIGKTSEEYFYLTSTIDPNGDLVYFLFDWGDGSNSDWIGPFESGEECNISHIWNEIGNYEIKVKAKDTEGLESDWSDPLVVRMPKNHIEICRYFVKNRLFSLFHLFSNIIL